MTKKQLITLKQIRFGLWTSARCCKENKWDSKESAQMFDSWATELEKVIVKVEANK